MKKLLLKKCKVVIKVMYCGLSLYVFFIDLSWEFIGGRIWLGEIVFLR